MTAFFPTPRLTGIRPRSRDTGCSQDTAGSEDTARSPLAGVHKPKTPGAHRLAPVHKLDVHYSARREPHYSSRRGPRLRARAWRSLFIAPCTSLRPCLRNSASWRAVVGWVRMTAFLSLLRDRILWPQTCGASRLRGTEIVFLQPAILTVIS